MRALLLNKMTPYREIDYIQLKNALSAYRDPHAKIRHWLASGALIRIKKGLYILGEDYNNSPIALDVLANLIYGPSAISLDYALSYYKLIPERVKTVTSITPQRDKLFDTPIGAFSYRYLTMKKYRAGLTRSTHHDGRHILIATPEKALIDKIYFSKSLALTNKNEVEDFLFSDLRLDQNTWQLLNKKHFSEIALIYKNTQVTMISNYLIRK